MQVYLIYSRWIYIAFLCIGVYLSSTPSAWTQNSTIKELKAALDQEYKEDTSKVDLLNKLSWETYPVNLDTSYHYANQAIALARQIGYKRGISRALNLQAIALSLWGMRDSAMAADKKGLEIAYEINDSFLISACLNDLAIFYSQLNNHDEALKAYQESLNYSTERDFKISAFTLGNIAIIHDELGNEQLAKDYLLKAIKIAEKSSDSLLIIKANQNFASFYFDKEDYDQALEYSHKAKAIAQKYGNNQSAAESCVSLGNIYAKKRLYEQSQYYFNEALSVFQNSGNKSSLMITLTNWASSLEENGDFPNAYDKAELGLRLANEDGNARMQLHFHRIISKASGELNLFERGYQSQSTLITLLDTLYEKDKQKIFAELETKYQLKQKETENQLLKVQQEETALKIKYQKSVIAGFAVISILLLSLGFVLYKAFQNKMRFNQQLRTEVAEKTETLTKTNEELMASNEELERFTFIASHDLKEPLRNIVSFISLLEREFPEISKGEIQTYFNFIKKNAKQMHYLIEDVLEFSRIKREEIQNAEVNVNRVIQNVQDSLATALQKKDALIQHGSLPRIVNSDAHLFLIFKNLIENGIKYNNKKQPIIRIDYQEQGNKHLFHIKDNGIGIESKYQPRVFDMFYRLHSREEYDGTGLGLAITKKLVKQIGGDIFLRSEPNQGSTFTLALPK